MILKMATLNDDNIAPRMAINLVDYNFYFDINLR